MTEKYGRLTIIESWKEKKYSSYETFVKCRCDCGNILESRRLNALRSGNTKSCGCLTKDLLNERNTTHGVSNHPSRGTYYSMISRCYDKRHKKYHNYGGRGITVCDEWLNDMRKFVEWADKNGFEKGLQLDRIDNNKGYFPGNCRWVTAGVNLRNTSHNVNYNGVCLKDYLTNLSKKHEISFSTLVYRYYRLIKNNREVTDDSLVNYKRLR